jgi:hypothetical protein
MTFFPTQSASAAEALGDGNAQASEQHKHAARTKVWITRERGGQRMTDIFKSETSLKRIYHDGPAGATFGSGQHTRQAGPRARDQRRPVSPERFGATI